MRFLLLLRQDDDVQVIKYFTAEIQGSHKPKQEAYLKALGTLNKVQIIFGLFKFKPVTTGTLDAIDGNRR